ncbi:FAD-dependent oxidoreductase [Streptomyces xantholiticus]|uniref:FAD-dependent oxidoreductase n=1 Tax=Streptomyces xantholiticus TaxID=68285 RepID=UPI00167A4A93|nr:FAD-dependent monooxygenase [Streptomyces xantholiticus]
MSRLRVLIVGGGVGGLALAGTLRRRGADVVVLEKAAELRVRGLGLSFWPNVTAVLRSMGLLGAIEEVSRPMNQVRISTTLGRTLTAIELDGYAVRFGAPSYSITRPELLQVLADWAGDTVRFGAEVVSVSPDGTVTLSDGEKLSADVVVGADGVGSRVREMIEPAGYVAPGTPEKMRGWQGLAPIDAGAGADFEIMFGAFGGAGLLRLAGGRTYWFFQGIPERMSNDRPPSTDGWPEPVRRAVAATPTDAVWKDNLRDRAPMKGWGKGRITLLGDAAHPILPTLGQGACLALEDAHVLSELLMDSGDPVAALRRYEQERYPRIRQMYLNSRRAAKLQRLRPAVRDRLLAAVPDPLYNAVFTAPARPIPNLRPGRNTPVAREASGV